MDKQAIKAENMDKQGSNRKKTARPSANDTIENITNQTKGIFEDLTSWMELKIQYIILDQKEQAKKQIVGFGLEAGALAIFAVAALFGLVALALGLGAWLNHPAWGFLAVMLLLVVFALVLGAIGRRARRPGNNEKELQPIDISDDKPQLPGPRIPENLGSQNGKG